MDLNTLLNKPVNDVQNIIHQEKDILGFILNNNEFAQTIFEQLTINHFSYKLHCTIFEVAKELFESGKRIDAIDVADSIDSNKLRYKKLYDLFDPDPLTYISSLIIKTSLKDIDSFNHRIKHLKETLLKYEITQALNKHDFEKLENLLAAIKSLKFSINKTDISLKQFGLTSKLEELEMRAKEEKFVLKGIALTGQITAIYAPSNTGKTLIVLRLITQEIVQRGLNPENVIYINADDTNKGLREKIAIAKEFGFEMLADNEAGFKIKELTKFLQMAIDNNTCNEIIIVDTLKKVVDLMDKKASSEFMKVARNYVQKGGTMILLAHTNKNKGVDGKHVYGGTNDIVSDCDCAYIASLLSEDDTHKTVIFENHKVRGTNEQEVVFKYIKRRQSYDDLIASVVTVTNEQIEELKEDRDRENDKHLIDAIKRAIEQGHQNKTALVAHAKKEPQCSKAKIEHTLDKYDQKLWFSITKQNNAQVYEMKG